jgi:hypothetical protein
VFDHVDDGVARDGVDAVVQVAVQDADFVVENMRPSPSPTYRELRMSVSTRIQRFGFQDTCYIVVPV